MRRVSGYGIIFGTALLARVLVSLLPVEYVVAGQATLWSWSFFVVFGLSFALSAFFANRTVLPTPPETWSGQVAGKTLPVAVGVAVGLLLIWADWVQPAAAARGLRTLHVSGPVALPFYLYGAILLTVVFHFLPVAFAAWLSKRWSPRARATMLLVAVAAVGFSEDLRYFLGQPPLRTVDAGRHLLSVAANAAEALMIWRLGLLAGLLQRGSTYLIWHLAWPLVGA